MSDIGMMSGGRSRDRTYDPLIKSQLGHLNQHTLRSFMGSKSHFASH
jgi:hypothetical protein